MEEARQRPIQPRQHLADRLQRAGIRGPLRGQRARHERNDAHVIPHAIDQAASQRACPSQVSTIRGTGSEGACSAR